MGRVRLGTVIGAAALALLVGGCAQAPPPLTYPSSPPLPTGSSLPGPGPGTGSPSATAAKYSKVLVIAEENHSYGEIIGDPAAPYVTMLANTYGTATNMNAGYPTGCPSLAAYILLTSGSTQGICDDDNPSAHQLSASSIFSQVDDAGMQWRNYAEDAPDNCAGTNADNDRFLVRHTPAPYYTSEAVRCASWDVPLGTVTSGALHDDVVLGTLPAYSFVTPDACGDMHGAPACPGGDVSIGDAWLRSWIPVIMGGPDYTAGRLVIIITWDEGNSSSNHIPTVVISPTTRGVSSGTAFTHCSTLRATEEILGLGTLGCAANAPSMLGPFHLGTGR